MSIEAPGVWTRQVSPPYRRAPGVARKNLPATYSSRQRHRGRTGSPAPAWEEKTAAAPAWVRRRRFHRRRQDGRPPGSAAGCTSVGRGR
jgi:hypothetical protein